MRLIAQQYSEHSPEVTGWYSGCQALKHSAFGSMVLPRRSLFALLSIDVSLVLLPLGDSYR